MSNPNPVGHFYLERSRREQIIIFVFCIAMITLIWYRTVLSPLLNTRKEYQTKIQAAFLELKGNDAQAKVIAENIKSSPMVTFNQKIKQLETELKTMDEKLGPFISSHINEQQFLGVLQSLLSNQKGLTFVNLKTLPPEAENLTPEKPENSNPKISAPASNPEILKENIILEFSGNYFDTLAYLKDLKNIRMHWQLDELNFKLLTYPQAQVSLKLHILVRNL